MKKTIRYVFRRMLSMTAALSIAFSACVPAFAEAAGSPTPTPDPHTPYYYEAAQSDALPNWPQAPEIEAQAAVVMDLQTGGIIYAKNADVVRYPASITKIMTGYLAARALNRSEQFAMLQSAAHGIESGSSSIYADTDELFTVEQAMMALMLASANEMALQLGEMTSGSVKKFTELMNRTARSLGCTQTHFNNPHGLPDEKHFTTARDMAIISRAAWQNPVFRSYVTTLHYDIPPTNIQKETRYLSNHHKMMAGMERAFDGVLGGKTGYTMAAGNTLVTYAQRGNMQVVVVILNGVDGGYPDTANLLEYAFTNFIRIDLGLNNEKCQLLPCDASILRGEEPFQFTQKVWITVPGNITKEMIQRTRQMKTSVICTPSVTNTFTYEGNVVGVYDQVEVSLGDCYFGIKTQTE